MARGIEELGDVLERSALSAVPDILAEIRNASTEVRAGAEEGWPEGRRWPGNSRPHSRDMFETITTRDGRAAVTVTIRNRAAYVRFIRPKVLAAETGRAKLAYSKWLWEPLKAKRDALVLVLADHVVEGLRRG